MLASGLWCRKRRVLLDALDGALSKKLNKEGEEGGENLERRIQKGEISEVGENLGRGENLERKKIQKEIFIGWTQKSILENVQSYVSLVFVHILRRENDRQNK